MPSFLSSPSKKVSGERHPPIMNNAGGQSQGAMATAHGVPPSTASTPYDAYAAKQQAAPESGGFFSRLFGSRKPKDTGGQRRTPVENAAIIQQNQPVAAPVEPVTAMEDNTYPDLASVPPAPPAKSKAAVQGEMDQMTRERDLAEAARKEFQQEEPAPVALMSQSPPPTAPMPRELPPADKMAKAGKPAPAAAPMRLTPPSPEAQPMQTAWNMPAPSEEIRLVPPRSDRVARVAFLPESRYAARRGAARAAHSHSY